jgi:hypothetical protein
VTKLTKMAVVAKAKKIVMTAGGLMVKVIME